MATSGSEQSTLVRELLATANSRGGWGYYRGKEGRLEPTVWALLALAPTDRNTADLARDREFLAACQRADGWLVENAAWPVHIGFNALALLILQSRSELIEPQQVKALAAALVHTKGVQVPPSPSFAQDNSLQGWSWNPETFSWVEPTAWGTLALKKALRTGILSDSVARPRIEEAERLLFDRCCHDGGWNFGNANVMGRDLFPHVPTTAIALLALQDRRDNAAVLRSLGFLEAHWAEESSLFALGLTLISLAVHGRPTAAVEQRLRAHIAQQSDADRATLPSGSIHGCAVALCALSFKESGDAFRI